MNASPPPISREALAALELKVLTVQRIEAAQWWRFKQVISPFSRLWLILDGHATVRHHGRTFELKAGRLHLVPAFTLHDCSCPRRFDHYHLHLVSRLPTGIDLFSMLDCEWQVSSPPGTVQLFQRLEALYPDRKLPCFDPFAEAYRRYPAQVEQPDQEAPAADWFEAQGILRLLLAPFLHTAHCHEGMHARVANRFLAVQEFIHRQMPEPITLGDLARVAGLHPTYFSDRFAQLVGMRPLEYLARRRIERAQYLLLTSTASVKEVAYEVGLRDPAYFTRLFAKLCQTSPSAYREAHGV